MPSTRQPRLRREGYAPIEDYALIGDGRTAALVALDGSIDWLCHPNLDSPSIFAALLDAERGGRFELHPAIPFESRRRYLPDTNVLETEFTTDRGSVRVVDTMTLPIGPMPPMRELVRKVEGLSGTVPMEWRFTPRFEYATGAGKYTHRYGAPVATFRAEAAGVASWDAGRPRWLDGTAAASFALTAGQRACLVLAMAYGEPLVLPGRAAAECRVDETAAFWRSWSASHQYQGPWLDLVQRSALVLKLLRFAPSGASVAAPTTSLPEEIGGARNWDYRFCWIRDSNFAMDALLTLGCYEEARSLFWWFMQATALTEPELHVIYKLDGALGTKECELPLSGYRASRPVRKGNSAAMQTQLDIYGALLDTAWIYSEGHHRLDYDTGVVLARIADHISTIWREPDSGIWEVRNGPFHFTHSKAMCWLALDRAARLADHQVLPAKHKTKWLQEAAAIRAFIEERCWSDTLNTYTRVADTPGVDASLLMLSLVGYTDPRGTRMNGTLDAIGHELRAGDFVYRYRAADGVSGDEGCFLNCSFWLVSALARAGRIEEAVNLMERLTSRANDVGLYSEEIDPVTGAFLGNFPQALVHLALIDAAFAIEAAHPQS